MDESNLQAIYEISGEIRHQKEAIKQFKIKLEDRLAELPAYTRVQMAKAELKEAKLQLNRQMLEDGSVVASQEHIAKMQADLRDLKEIVSLHLTRHYLDSGGEHVPIHDEPNKSQEVIIKAKLGRVIIMEAHK